VLFRSDPRTGTDAQAIGISREQWEAARSALDAAGVPVLADADAAWAEFRHWRGLYERSVVVLAAATSSPPSPWIERVPAPRVRYLRAGRR
jgi:hypothetical protein